jgi:hypothetical protein
MFVIELQGMAILRHPKERWVGGRDAIHETTSGVLGFGPRRH